jgi:hypothetical protein
MEYRNACHSCKHGETIPQSGSHLRCTNPLVAREAPHFIAKIAGGEAATNLPGSLDIEGDEHGIKKGWFAWPVNFDPVWLKHCRGYLKRGKT